MKYILYVTICIANCKFYVGVHKTVDPAVFDGYLGCGVYTTRPSSYKKSKTPFQYAVNKYGIDKFKRIVLATFDTAEEAFNLEKQIVTQEFIQNPNNYNFKLGGEGGCADNRKVTIYMYDLEGNFVKEFESAFDCNRYFDINAVNGSAVLKAARLGQTLHGYQFSKEKLPYMKKYIPKNGSHNNKHKVGKYNENDELLEIYESTHACERAGYKNIQKALRTGRKCKGFYFKRIFD